MWQKRGLTGRKRVSVGVCQMFRLSVAVAGFDMSPRLMSFIHDLAMIFDAAEGHIPPGTSFLTSILGHTASLPAPLSIDLEIFPWTRGRANHGSQGSYSPWRFIRDEHGLLVLRAFDFPGLLLNVLRYLRPLLHWPG